MSRYRTILVGLIASLVTAVGLLPWILELDRRPIDLATTGGTEIATDSPSSGFDPSRRAPLGWDTFESDELPDVGDLRCDGMPTEDCVVHRSDGPHVLLLGDSHGQRLAPALTALASEYGFTLSISVVESCRWQIGLAPEPFREEACYPMRDDLYERVLRELAPDIVLTVSVGLEPFGVRDPALEGLPLAELIRTTTQDSSRRILEHASHLLLLEPLPLAGFNVADCLSREPAVANCAFEYTDVPDDPENLVATYATVYRTEALADARISSAPYDRLVCPTGSPCIPIEDGISTINDSTHVNFVQAYRQRERIWEVLAPVVSRFGAPSPDE